MKINWLTYLYIICLALFSSCGSADVSDVTMQEKSEEYIDSYAEGEKAAYAEVTEEAAEEEMVEKDVEYSKNNSDDATYPIITTDQLIALQERSVQKVTELFEYITIMANEEYDIEMRKNAKKMAINLFDDNARIYSPSITGLQDSVVVKMVLKDILKGKYPLELVSVEDVDVADDGTIYCKLIANNIGFELLVNVRIEFETKHFGNETLEVWSANLGDIVEN
jgi:hypothetical protein